jgi:hypothetical protein
MLGRAEATRDSHKPQGVALGEPLITTRAPLIKHTHAASELSK